MKRKLNTYLIAGVFLTYYGLSDDTFVFWYNGIALIFGIAAFALAFIEYQKMKREK